MSNLDYPISLLVAEGNKIANTPIYGHEAMKEKASKLKSINNATDILRKKKHKEEEEKRKDDEQKREPFAYVKR
jgi:hypothetical protein